MKRLVLQLVVIVVALAVGYWRGMEVMGLRLERDSTEASTTAAQDSVSRAAQKAAEVAELEQRLSPEPAVLWPEKVVLFAAFDNVVENDRRLSNLTQAIHDLNNGHELTWEDVSVDPSVARTRQADLTKVVVGELLAVIRLPRDARTRYQMGEHRVPLENGPELIQHVVELLRVAGLRPVDVGQSEASLKEIARRDVADQVRVIELELLRMPKGWGGQLEGDLHAVVWTAVNYGLTAGEIGLTQVRVDTVMTWKSYN